jgi:hypothetical protein
VKRRLAGLTLAIVLPLRPAGADQAAPGWSGLREHASAIVVGYVAKVESGAPPGAQQATLDVQELWYGRAPSSLTLAGSLTDPTLPVFEPGRLVLAFLRSDVSGGFEPVAQASGVVELSAAGLEAARLLVRAALARGVELRLEDVEPSLRADLVPAPRVLVESVLVEIRRPLDAADHSLLLAMACDTQHHYQSDARRWALRTAGELKSADARSCLEAVVSTAGSPLRLTASEALGDLGDPRSASALGAVLDEMPDSSDPQARRADGGLTLSIVLSLGKIRSAEAVPALESLAREGDDLALHSTVVHALGLIRGAAAVRVLGDISRGHPNALVRDQAQRTLERLAGRMS